MSIPGYNFKKTYKHIKTEESVLCSIQVSGWVPTAYVVQEIFRVAKEDFPSLQPTDIGISTGESPQEGITKASFLTKDPIPQTYKLALK